ncbi:MAG: 2,3-bisphosphoglycerate-dependent phosphoglycerate mutase [Betaproteobacteria bacterium]|jgi:probable phosphoglycerate mutase|nr:2,3-bisphosphoglycerate-dependent phosphoglycerate mutase [Betaproteobacteria bacterium]
MTLLALLRHGETAWSAEGRIQGRRDEPLSQAGRAALSSVRLPAACQGMRVVTSPLARCVETAVLLGAPRAAREPRLAEMSWGDWEGRRLEDLRAELGEAMRENEARGLDFRPAGGESPREVLARVSQWLALVSEPTLAVTHRGVIRAVLAAATGWDMRGAPPAKLDWSAFHLFRLDRIGAATIERLNVR